MERGQMQRERGTYRHINAVGLSEAWLPKVTMALPSPGPRGTGPSMAKPCHAGQGNLGGGPAQGDPPEARLPRKAWRRPPVV